MFFSTMYWQEEMMPKNFQSFVHCEKIEKKKLVALFANTNLEK